MYLPKIDEISLTRNEKIIYDFLITKKESVFLYTELDISKLTGISQPTVSRFWKKIGYKNLKDFKDTIKEFQESPTPSLKFKSTLNTNNFHFKNYAKRSVRLLEDSANKINEKDFTIAVDWFNKSSKIFTHGIGPAESLCYLLNFRLNRFGLNISSLPSNGQEIYEVLININKDDLIVLFLFSHYHPETHVILDYAKENNIKVILITDILIKPHEDKNLLTIYVARGELFEFHSLVGPLFLIESLIVAIGSSKENQSLETLQKLESIREKYEKFIPRNLK